MTIVFDLDGTLVDTRDAVFAAYAEVGVHMPALGWGKPWEEWLRTPAGQPDHALHAAKNAVYPRFLARLARPTRLLEYAVSNRCPVLTGASRPAVEAIEACFGVDLNVAGYCLSAMDKVMHLIEPAFPLGTLPHIYVDDDATVRRVVSECTTWSVLCPHHASVLLSSRPGPTRG